jgi:hypothetical protein
MKSHASILALLCCLGDIPAGAYPPAPFYTIYGTVRDDHGNPLASGNGVVVMSGHYAAFGTAAVSSGAITGVTILNGGSGINAAGVAVLTNGVVTGITVTNSGSGYTSPATVGITGGGAHAVEIVRSATDSSIAPGINYSLSVPMDSAVTSQLYDVTVMRPLLPFTIRVVIDGVNYVPMQIAGAASAFWRSRINSVNSPGISSQGSNWAVGLPAGKLRLDLTLGVDSNNDGLPDEWQWDVVNSDTTGRLTDFSQVDPNADFSGNGMTNMGKFLTGVYALEALDGLHFEIDSITNGIAKLHFQAITGRTYHIVSSDDLKTWTNPQPFSVSSDGLNPKSYHLAASTEILNIYVPLVVSKKKFFNLYVE